MSAYTKSVTKVTIYKSKEGEFQMSSNKTNVPEAKSAMNRAKTYRDVMKAKKQELKNAKSAVKEIPYFMNDEKSKIESLMVKFRKTVEMLKTSSDSQKIENLKDISQLIADSLTTQFLDNNYQVTSQYQSIHNRMGELNQSLEQLDWLRG